jgi:hypothetical protein
MIKTKGENIGGRQINRKTSSIAYERIKVREKRSRSECRKLKGAMSPKKMKSYQQISTLGIKLKTKIMIMKKKIKKK